MQVTIDYTKQDAIPYLKTINLINNFVINTTKFINKFSFICEEKLETVSGNIERLEITMNILEAKLSSIPGLEGGSAPIAPPPSTTTEAPPSESMELPEVEKEEKEIASTLTVKEDPRYAPYFKMMKYGVPEIQIKGKLAASGLNPDYLDTPDAPAPPMGSVVPDLEPSRNSDDEKEEEKEEKEEEEEEEEEVEDE